ncbi:aldehyde dehydrogenase family protein [Nannocystis pusilla]|uniref:Aldehyde dehydrogenase n=1 Tax=Nannocystis pusilla TaxID=889268 RepID=A0ABS7U6I2_9BACT|nr:aldehyde dehydrogenase family protein [Nannocystis pusilla]MBZ5716001.1 aldehyde dehydrogenase family protein [Nannocystis pusilla]
MATTLRTVPPEPPPPPTTLPCCDPATGERFGEAPVMDRAAVVATVQRARAAQAAWAATSWAERRAVLSDILEHVVRHQEEICRLAVRDSGKTMVDAAMGEIFPVCEKLRYTIAHGEADLRAERRPSGFLPHKAARVEYLPLGVIGVIAPWNFPFHNFFCPTIPALFAGNAVVVKVSELATWSSLRYVEIFAEVLRKRGHSPDLVQIVTGYGETGSALVTSGVDKIFFTGSPQNGRKVMAAAAETLTPVVLELGGKDPMIVCDDADLEQAVSTATFGVFNACGQMCVGAERLYVFAGIYDAFVREVVARAKALRQGPPLQGEVDLGAMTMPRQVQIIQELVDDAVAKGARVLCGGSPREDLPGNFYPPTVLVDVDHSMRITQEEQFGPVMVIMKVNSESEAIRLANDCPYGLGSSVFTRDPARGERLARAIAAGMTTVNDFGLAYMIQSLPFGGLKISGFGRINGREGLRACCNEKAIVTDRVPVRQGMALYPVRPATLELVTGAVRAIYGAGIGKKARGALQIARSLLSLAKGQRSSARS